MFREYQHLKLAYWLLNKPCLVYRIIGIAYTKNSEFKNIKHYPKIIWFQSVNYHVDCLLDLLQMGVNVPVLELIDNHRSCRVTFIIREALVSSHQIKEFTKWLLKIEACTDSWSFDHLNIYFGLRDICENDLLFRMINFIIALWIWIMILLQVSLLKEKCKYLIPLWNSWVHLNFCTSIQAVLTLISNHLKLGFVCC